jgi:ankyrin repeat protein
MLLQKDLGSPIVHACCQGYVSLVELFLKTAFDINQLETYTGMTLLHLAVTHRRPQMVKYLLDNGADVSKKDRGQRAVWEMDINEDNSYEAAEIRSMLADARNGEVKEKNPITRFVTGKKIK